MGLRPPGRDFPRSALRQRRDLLGSGQAEASRCMPRPVNRMVRAPYLIFTSGKNAAVLAALSPDGNPS